jgi:hypothetical protein
MLLLIDANIYRHPAAGAYVHVNDELLMWGPRIIATRTYQYRYKPPKKRKIADEVYFVPALAKGARQHQVQFFTYWLIDYEMMGMPPAFDWIGRSTFDLFGPEWLPQREPYYRGFICKSGTDFDLMTAVRSFILGVEDARLKEILNAFGLENSQDAFHVWICEREGIDCIVTLDGPFRTKLHQVRRKLSLNLDARFPSEICGRLGIKPVDHSWFEEFEAFRNTRLITLFDRRASIRDIIIFRLYKACVRLSKKFRLPIDFVIPGYDDGAPRAGAHLRH